MDTIKVESVLQTFIYFVKGDKARFAEILPFSPIPVGTEAVFTDGQLTITGRVAPWRMQGADVAWDVPGSIVIDTKPE